MTKVFKMEDLDCANCARKMEDGIRKLNGVTDVHVNFLTQKMILTADDANFDLIASEAAKICAKVDRNCKVIL